MKKFIHIIPANAIGGVESAAKTSIGLNSKNFNLEIIFLSSIKNKKSIFSQIRYLFESFINTMKIIKKKPDYIIVSLWKSCLSAFLVYLINPNTKIILFLHLPKSINFFDFYFTKLISRKAVEIWADSNKTLLARCKELKIEDNVKTNIISFVRNKISKKENNEHYEAYAKFIFWGRLHHQKRLDKSLRLIQKLKSKGLDEVEFLVIGPDCGELLNLKYLADRLKIKDKIYFKKELPLEEIIENSKEYTFFLQLSDFEGMGMSVIESMQIGLIPVITDVGEISQYCKNQINSLVYENLEKTSNDILSLLLNKKKLRLIQNNAFKTWENFPTYRKDIFNNLELISKDATN